MTKTEIIHETKIETAIVKRKTNNNGINRFGEVKDGILDISEGIGTKRIPIENMIAAMKIGI